MGCDRHLPKEKRKAMTTANELKAQIEDAIENLWWSSESDYPVSLVWQPPAEISVAQVRQLAGCDEDAPIQIVNVNDFFARAIAPQSWHTSDDEAQLAQLKKLKILLTQSLAHLQVYRCGAVEISVYVIGNAPDGSIAGVKTILVET
jgi:Nuclease A inhibitor-like protein